MGVKEKDHVLDGERYVIYRVSKTTSLQLIVIEKKAIVHEVNRSLESSSVLSFG